LKEQAQKEFFKAWMNYLKAVNLKKGIQEAEAILETKKLQLSEVLKGVCYDN
jgi:hypothetical protein